MSVFQNLHKKLASALGVESDSLLASAVKIYTKDEKIPKEAAQTKTETLSITSCQAHKMSYLGDSVLLTIDNIGCVAAAISFGLVDKNQKEPLSGKRVYTDIMAENFGNTDSFIPPSPFDFSSGTVYACRDTNRMEFSLFGHEDSGRFKDLSISKKAVDEMIAIQPATTKGVFFFSKDFNEIDIIPDVIILSLRPVELTKIIQSYQFITGERVIANIGPVRAVNSDLIVRPYLTQKINISPYCVGARILSQLPPDRMGVGIPFACFKIIVEGAEQSKKGYPFELYPGSIS